MEPCGHMGLKSYFFFPLCILTGVAASHQVIMASDYQNQKVYTSLFIFCAMPGDWLPSDTFIVGKECIKITSAKFLRKPEAIRCVIHTFVKALLLKKYQHRPISGDKVVPMCTAGKNYL